MKRLLALVIAAGLFLPLALGCGDDTGKKGGTGTATTPAKDKATPTTPPAGKDKAGAPTTPPKEK